MLIPWREIKELEVFNIRRFIFLGVHSELTGPVVKFGDFGVYSPEV